MSTISRRLERRFRRFRAFLAQLRHRLSTSVLELLDFDREVEEDEEEEDGILLDERLRRLVDDRVLLSTPERSSLTERR